MGSAKELGVVIVGTNSTAVDATIARIIGLEPKKIGYLQLAARGLGPVDQRWIKQVGEPWQDVAAPFQIIDSPDLQFLRVKPGELVS
jgi:uncharacterized protein (DUF362 family)